MMMNLSDFPCLSIVEANTFFSLKLQNKSQVQDAIIS